MVKLNPRNVIDLDSEGIKDLVLALDIYNIYLDEVWGFYHGTSVVHHGLRLPMFGAFAVHSCQLTIIPKSSA
jgi:hypothetical protein